MGRLRPELGRAVEDLQGDGVIVTKPAFGTQVAFKKSDDAWAPLWLRRPDILTDQAPISLAVRSLGDAYVRNV